MSNVSELGFAPVDLQVEGNLTPMPASREAVVRFEQSFNASAAAPSRAEAAQPMQFIATAARNESATSATLERITEYTNKVSESWNTGQAAMERLLALDNLSPKEVLAVQYQITTAMLNVELASRVGGMSEQGIQTLIQRNQ